MNNDAILRSLWWTLHAFLFFPGPQAIYIHRNSSCMDMGPSTPVKLRRAVCVHHRYKNTGEYICSRISQRHVYICSVYGNHACKSWGQSGANWGCGDFLIFCAHTHGNTWDPRACTGIAKSTHMQRQCDIIIDVSDTKNVWESPGTIQPRSAQLHTNTFFRCACESR
jgi:hypothetical protein